MGHILSLSENATGCFFSFGFYCYCRTAFSFCDETIKKKVLLRGPVVFAFLCRYSFLHSFERGSIVQTTSIILCHTVLVVCGKGWELGKRHQRLHYVVVLEM